MKCAVIFFTRTNNSRRIAGKIADKLSCELIQITDNINWNGILGFIKAGYYSSLNKKVEINTPRNINSFEEYIVVTPLWAGAIAPAIRALLRTIPPEKVHLVVTSDGGHVKNRSGYKSIHDVINNNNSEDLVINVLVKELLGIQSNSDAVDTKNN
jgi:hypothetical protein